MKENVVVDSTETGQQHILDDIGHEHKNGIIFVKSLNGYLNLLWLWMDRGCAITISNLVFKLFSYS